MYCFSAKLFPLFGVCTFDMHLAMMVAYNYLSTDKHLLQINIFVTFH